MPEPGQLESPKAPVATESIVVPTMTVAAEENSDATANVMDDPTAAPSTEALAPTERAEDDSESSGASEHGEYIDVEWGSEVTFDDMLQMVVDGKVAVIEWYALPNAIRLVSSSKDYSHVQNAKWGRSVKKELDALGVRTGKGGIPLNYYFCN